MTVPFEISVFALSWSCGLSLWLLGIVNLVWWIDSNCVTLFQILSNFYLPGLESDVEDKEKMKPKESQRKEGMNPIVYQLGDFDLTIPKGEDI